MSTKLSLKQNINFMALRKPAMILSTIMILVSIACLATLKLNVGIDFTGGSIIEVGYQQAVELEPIRDVLNDNGYDDAVVQHFGSASEVLIRLVPKVGQNEAQTSSDVIKLLRNMTDETVQERRVEYVGPQVGEELTEDGGLAVLYALIAILIYVSVRFEYRFSLGAVAAFIHDVLSTLGIFSLLWLDLVLRVCAATLPCLCFSLYVYLVSF